MRQVLLPWNFYHVRGHGYEGMGWVILGRIALGGLLFVEHICLLFALEYLKVPVAMSLIYTYPLMVALFGIVTNRAAVSRGLFGALSCCLVGVVLVLKLSVEQIN